jgi:hypothetical protein
LKRDEGSLNNKLTALLRMGGCTDVIEEEEDNNTAATNTAQVSANRRRPTSTNEGGCNGRKIGVPI